MGKSRHFSWSYSRSETLRLCPRKFFFQYYSQSEPQIDAAAWKLRELTTLSMSAGSAVDFVLSRALDRIRKGGEVKELAKYGIRHYRKGLERSKGIVAVMKSRARSSEERRSEPFRPLQHHYYNFDVGDDNIAYIEERVGRCLGNFEASETFARLKEAGAENWGLIAKVDEDVAPSFQLNGHKIYAAYDLWFKVGTELFVLDWKSGPEKEYSKSAAERQLAVYALWGAYSLKHPLNQIRTQAIWLQGEADWAPTQVKKANVAEIRDLILSEIDNEVALLDIQTFKSGRKEFRANIDMFPPKPKHQVCLNCCYREICIEGQATCSHVPKSGILDCESRLI